MKNYQKELDALKVRYDKLNQKYRTLKADVKDKQEVNSKESEILAEMIGDIENSQKEFESLRNEMNVVVSELKTEREQYRVLIDQVIEIKNEMLSGMKMSLFAKLQYKLKNK